MNHVLLLVPVLYLEAAALAAAQLSGNESDASTDFFARQVVDEGGAVTHHLAATFVSEAALAALPALSASFPGSDWVLYRKNGARSPSVDLNAWLEDHGLRLKE